MEADRESTDSLSHLTSQSQTALKFTVRATDVECLLMADAWWRGVNLIKLRTKHPNADCNLLDQAEKQYWKSIVPAQALIPQYFAVK